MCLHWAICSLLEEPQQVGHGLPFLVVGRINSSSAAVYTQEEFIYSSVQQHEMDGALITFPTAPFIHLFCDTELHTQVCGFCVSHSLLTGSEPLGRLTPATVTEQRMEDALLTRYR